MTTGLLAAFSNTSLRSMLKPDVLENLVMGFVEFEPKLVKALEILAMKAELTAQVT